MSLKLSMTLVSGYLALVMVPSVISHGYSHAICQCHHMEQNPVCGSDGRTYSNNCEASCNYAGVQCFGPCPCSQPANCICPHSFDPVCGFDGVTYGSQCEANCAYPCEDPCNYVSVQCVGACPCPQPANCICPHVFDPVCGSDGVTYSNQCEANCAGKMVVCKGSCNSCLSPYFLYPGGIQQRSGITIGQPTKCICPRNFDPVCGSDGVTYSNQCEANCAGKMVVCKGSCNSCLSPYFIYPGGIQPSQGMAMGQSAKCVCPRNFDPVCGTDGVTYSNQCQAECSGKMVVCKGRCNDCLKPSYSTYSGGSQPRPRDAGTRSRLGSAHRPQLLPIMNKMS